ncbi:gigasin-3a-like [Littorina saxatilis]|uniref:gigasin-3a-like n=1 Tax=Littorina saxatilis TaxID=31220 RepID=UPI0038B6A7F2
MLFTKVNGRGDSSDSKMTKFVTFGGRSFSIRALPDLDLLYDSGNDIEHRMAAEASDVFNCPVQDGPNVVRYDRDKTSIHVGPKPISITSGRLGSLSLIFVGLANPGGVLLYSLPLNSERPRFESTWIGLSDAFKSWDELYMETGLGGITVTDLSFIPSHQTGSGVPWLLVAGSKSGTVTLLKIKGNGDIPYFPSRADSLKSSAVTVVIYSLLLVTVLTAT